MDENIKKFYKKVRSIRLEVRKKKKEATLFLPSVCDAQHFIDYLKEKKLYKDHWKGDGEKIVDSCTYELAKKIKNSMDKITTDGKPNSEKRLANYLNNITSISPHHARLSNFWQFEKDCMEGFLEPFKIDGRRRQPLSDTVEEEGEEEGEIGPGVWVPGKGWINEDAFEGFDMPPEQGVSAAGSKSPRPSGVVDVSKGQLGKKRKPIIKRIKKTKSKGIKKTKSKGTKSKPTKSKPTKKTKRKPKNKRTKKESKKTTRS
jgi:hypothetical protein